MDSSLKMVITNLYPDYEEKEINLQINFTDPDCIQYFNKLKLIITDDYPRPILNDDNLEHYYKLYGINWMKIKERGKFRYKCLLCEKLIVSLGTLFTHINIHRNERLYGCQHCELKYFSKKSLTSHVGKVHSDKVDWKFFCPLCNKGYMRKSSFMLHLEIESAKQ